MIEYIPFDPSMIGQKEIIIWCPEAEDYAVLMEILRDRDVLWGGRTAPKKSDIHYNNDQSCVRITTDFFMTRSSKRFYEQSFREGRYQSYTFVKYPGSEVTVDVGDLI